MKGGRQRSLDLLKLGLAVAVVALHAQVLREWGPRVSFFMADGICRLAVPTFLVINGFFFEAAVAGGRTRSWFRHLLGLYLLWTVLYLPFDLMEHRRVAFSLTWFLRDLVMGYKHLWYVSATLMGAGLCLMVRRLPGRWVLGLSLLALGTGLGLQYASSYGGLGKGWLEALGYDAYRNGIFFGFPFVALGGWIRRQDWPGRLPKGRVSVALALALLAFGVEVGLNAFHPARLRGFDLYLTLLVAAPLLFIRVLQDERTTEVGLWGPLANAIYFVHPAIYFIALHEGMSLGTPLFALTVALSALVGWVIVRLKERGLPLL